MPAILDFWRSSLHLLAPKPFFGIIKNSIILFGKTITTVIKNFWWVIIIDIALFMLLGDIFAKAATMSTLKLSHLLIFIQSAFWFIITSAFLIFMRNKETGDPKAYFRTYFFRYVQLLLFFSCLFLITLQLLIGGGITMPTPHYLFLILLKVIEFCIAFFWLDSKHRFIYILSAVERAINLIFYNIPIIIVLFTILFAFDRSLCFFTAKLVGATPPSMVFSQTVYKIIQEAPPSRHLAKIVVIKYATFLVEFLWLCLFFMFYRYKKNERYTSTIFG